VNRENKVEDRTQKEAKMNALDHNITNHERVEALSILRSIANRVSQLSETLWLVITFLLFIVMGPFSIIAVVYGIWSLSSGENREKMVEPASC
jgi:hypothetical protein